MVALVRTPDGRLEEVETEESTESSKKTSSGWTSYIQAKRWEGTVGRPEIQKFAGALQGQRASKGVFITTSGFSKEAEEYSAVISSKVILITGELLATLMVDHNVGVSPVSKFELKRIDSDYFEGENV